MQHKPASPKRFATTRWSVVQAAGNAAHPDAKTALTSLCQLYWYPLYAFVRRSGHDQHDAAELTQEFFVRVLARNDLAKVAPERGRFRSWLLQSMRNFLANEWDRQSAQKRGGGREELRLDVFEGERRYALEPANVDTPEKLYMRRWTMDLIARALEQLRLENLDKEELFEALKSRIASGEDGYDDLAHKLGMKPGALKTAASRLRSRFRVLLRAEIADTVADGDVDDEFRSLLSEIS